MFGSGVVKATLSVRRRPGRPAGGLDEVRVAFSTTSRRIWQKRRLATPPRHAAMTRGHAPGHAPLLGGPRAAWSVR